MTDPIEMARALVEGNREANRELSNKLREAEQEVASLKHKIDTNSKVINTLCDWLRNQNVKIEDSPCQSSTQAEDVEGLSGAIKPPQTEGEALRKPTKTRTEIFAEVLREHGPMDIASMREPVRAKGYGVEMKDNIIYNSIYTSLARHPELFERAGNIWKLKDGVEPQADGGLFDRDESATD